MEKIRICTLICIFVSEFGQYAVDTNLLGLHGGYWIRTRTSLLIIPGKLRQLFIKGVKLSSLAQTVMFKLGTILMAMT
jgi:hypothetical protein